MMVCPVEAVITDIGHVLLSNVEMFRELLFEILLTKFVIGLEKLTQNCWELDFKGRVLIVSCLLNYTLSAVYNI
jgi:hypothetical protein